MGSPSLLSQMPERDVMRVVGHAWDVAARAGFGGAVALVLTFALAACSPGVGPAADSEIARLTAENQRLSSALATATARIADLEKRIAELEVAARSGAAAADPSAATSTASGATGGAQKPPATGPTARQFTYLKDVYRSAGTIWAVADYAQMLTGAAAVKAAREDGEIGPGEDVPNDYYIRNQNKQLRKMAVVPGAPVLFHKTNQGRWNGAGSAGDLVDIFKSSGDDARFMKNAPYWITLKGGRIAKVEQQYVP